MSEEFDNIDADIINSILEDENKVNINNVDFQKLGFGIPRDFPFGEMPRKNYENLLNNVEYKEELRDIIRNYYDNLRVNPAEALRTTVSQMLFLNNKLKLTERGKNIVDIVSDIPNVEGTPYKIKHLRPKDIIKLGIDIPDELLTTVRTSESNFNMLLTSNTLRDRLKAIIDKYKEEVKTNPEVALNSAKTDIKKLKLTMSKTKVNMQRTKSRQISDVYQSEVARDIANFMDTETGINFSRIPFPIPPEYPLGGMTQEQFEVLLTSPSHLNWLRKSVIMFNHEFLIKSTTAIKLAKLDVRSMINSIQKMIETKNATRGGGRRRRHVSRKIRKRCQGRRRRVSRRRSVV